MKDKKEKDECIKKFAAEQMEIQEKILEMVREKTDGSLKQMVVHLETVEISLRMLIAEMKDREATKVKYSNA